jgi:hypothetical protein
VAFLHIRFFISTQGQLETQLTRVLRRAERATQWRSELQAKLKRATGNIHITRSSIIKNHETLAEHRQYELFMDRLTPEQFQRTEYFDRPSRLIERMDGFEQGNLMLIQTIRFYGEKIDEYDREFKRATMESGERIAIIEDLLRRLPEAVEEASKLGGGPVTIAFQGNPRPPMNGWESPPISPQLNAEQ